MSSSSGMFTLAITEVNCSTLLNVMQKYRDYKKQFSDKHMINMEIVNKQNYPKNNDAIIAKYLSNVYNLMKVSNDDNASNIQALFRYYETRSKSFMFFPLSTIFKNYKPIECKLILNNKNKTFNKCRIYGIDKNYHIAVKFTVEHEGESIETYAYIRPDTDLKIDNNSDNIATEVMDFEVTDDRPRVTELDSAVFDYDTTYMDISENDPKMYDNMTGGAKSVTQQEVENKLEQLLSMDNTAKSSDIPDIC